MSSLATRPRLPKQHRQVRILKPEVLTLAITLTLSGLPLLVHALDGDKSRRQAPAQHKKPELARLSERVTVHAAGRGNPTMNLSDGHEVLTSYVGGEDLQVALEQNRAEPLSLASADFDEDGVPDFVAGYGYQGRGILTVLRGNVDSIYPNAPEAQQRKSNGTFSSLPFMSPARVFGLDQRADFIGAGDFDGDSHWDIVVASSVARALYLLSGDGNGGFAPAQEISLPGVVTAMTTGEVNRRDGLTDVIVGIANERQSQVVVFEGPNGALKSEPERFNMPAEVGSVALGQIDGRYTMDLAVAAGNELIVLAGRDRKLSLDENQQATVSPASRSHRIFASRITSMTLGDFTGGSRTDVALLMDDGEVQLLSQGKMGAKGTSRETIETWKAVCFSFRLSSPANQLISTHTSSAAHDDLLIADAANNRLHVLTSADSEGARAAAAPAERTQVTSPSLHLTASLDVTGAPVAVLPMRLNGDALSDLMVLTNKQSTPAVVMNQPQATFVVVNTNATGTGSLQFAILDANETPGADTITFNIPGTSPFIINQTVPLPVVTDPVTIDGTTQQGFAGSPVIHLSGDVGVDGIVISAGISTVRGLALYPFRYAIRLQDNGANIIEGNWVGYDLSGTPTAGSPVGVFAPNNVIGGTVAAARNRLSGLQCFNNSGGNVVRGNFFHLNVDGTANSSSGVPLQIRKSSANTIGGTLAGARNIISSNIGQQGIIIEGEGGPTTGNLVQSNFIGTDVTGTVDLGNREEGVVIREQAHNNTVGGTTVAARNVISGNERYGVLIGGSTGNQVQGNYIGTDANGTADLGNSQNGVVISSIDGHASPGSNTSDNVVGGTAAGAANIVSGNGFSGVLIEGPQTTGTLVQGNFIGTNAAGTGALPNDLNGVTTSQAPNNTIGGATTAARNVISGNGRHGVSVGIDTNSGSSGVSVRNNYIGTDVTGNACLGNQRDGVFVNRGSVSHTIADNLITCNARNGVNIPNFATNDPGIRIEVTNNSIFANATLGIDLGDSGITANDPGDPDAGANFLQNFPVLTSFAGSAPVRAETPGSSSSDGEPPADELTVAVNGTLNSTANTSFTVHWYFSADAQCVTNQAGSRPLVTGRVSNVTTDGSGNAPFNFPFDFPVGINSGIINCTATDPQGNTSEFSACLAVSGGGTPTPTIQFTSTSYSVTENGGSASVVVTRSGDTSSASTVDYNTGDTAGNANCNVLNSGNPSSRCDYATTIGRLRFAAGEASKTVPILIIDDSYADGSETLSVTLGNATGASLGSPSTAIVTINDNETANGANPIGQAAFFAREHYIDFFSREPDASGLAFWTNQITSCGTDTTCIELRRINVSAAFFLSIEFQQTGYLVYRMYKAAYGNVAGTPVPVRFNEFLPDTQQIGQGVVVGQPGWEQVLEDNKNLFAADFVARPAFSTAHPTSLTPAQFVDALFVNAVVIPTAAERMAAINEFPTAVNSADAAARGRALRRVSENPALAQQEFNKAFVLMQYLGYLRRNPNDAPDTNFDGYNFWLGKLNEFNGNFVNAEMVKAFIVSGEYQQRFGP